MKKKENTNCVSLQPRDMRVSSFRSPSMVDSFLFQKHESAVDGVPSVRCTSDIYMLFNQWRLDRLSREALLQHFDNMSVSHPVLKELKSKLTDDQLITLVKSRYIQQPSELLNWSMYLNSLADEQLKAFTAQKDFVEQQKRVEAEKAAAAAASSSSSASASAAE